MVYVRAQTTKRVNKYNMQHIYPSFSRHVRQNLPTGRMALAYGSKKTLEIHILLQRIKCSVTWWDYLCREPPVITLQKMQHKLESLIILRLIEVL
jgi:hypothetical protein